MDQLHNESDDEKTLAVIRNGNKEVVLDFLQHHDFNFAATDNNGNTLLHLIIENDKLKEIEMLDIVEFLLNTNFDPNIENADQLTALHLAVAKRMKGLIDILIQYNAYIDKKSKEGNSIAHYCIEVENKKFKHEFSSMKIDTNGSDIWDSEMEKKSASFVEWLIQKGFDFDDENIAGETALDLAINHNLLHILPVLLNKTNSIKHLATLYLHGDYKSTLPQFLNYKFLPIPYCKQYVSSILKILINRRTSVIVQNNEDVQFINAVVDDLSKNGIDNCASNWFHAIMRSCGFWKDWTSYPFQILNDLLSKGADVNHQNEFNCFTPLYLALEVKSLPALKFLMKNGAQFCLKTEDRRNWLHLIVLKNYGGPNIDSDLPDDIRTDLIDILISEGCDINKADMNGMLPLQFAAKLKDVTIVTKLLQLGADVNCTNITMSTPLHYAFFNPLDNYTNLVELLLDHGANVNAKNYWGRRPIHLAASIKTGSMLGVMKVLLLKGAYVDVCDNKGRSVLCYTFLNNMRFDDLKELLEWNADIINHDSILDLLPCRDLHNNHIMRRLVERWIKLKKANLPCSDKYEQYLYFIPKTRPATRHVTRNSNEEFFLDEIMPQIELEIKLLKRTFINDRVTLYTFLHMNTESRRAYVNNEKLLSIINSPSLKKTFPKYSTLILAKFRQIVAWKGLLEPAKLAWLELTQIYLPDICLDRIFAHFSNADLVNIIEKDISKEKINFNSSKAKYEMYI